MSTIIKDEADAILADPDGKTEEVFEKTQVIVKQLEGCGPMIQAAILSDLVSMWLAGHRTEPRDAAAEKTLRSSLIEGFLGQVLRLLPINDEALDDMYPDDRPPHAVN